MSRRFLIGAIAVVLAGIGLLAFLSWQEKASYKVTFSSEKEMAEAAAALGRTNAPAQAVLVLLDLSQPVRLAVGGLGLADENQNQRLGDLITVELTGAPGFNLVERQSLTAILRELNLSLSGFVRAKDAVRAGRLLKADWFLLGTEAKINGTNSIVIRVVDARTGVMRDAGVVPASQSPAKLAADVAAFVRQSRQNAASAKTRVYLAIGAFEDVSVNNRQADFPTQLHGYLIAAYQGVNVTLLEREYVETLLQEVRLDLAGLTEDSGTNPPPPMQSAFWLVSGQYQSYETTNLQVELNLEVQRIFGQAKRFTLRGLPGESVSHQIKAAIDETMNQNSASLIVTRASEARIQMSIGKDLTVWNGIESHDDYDPVVIGSNWYGNSRSEPQLAAKQKRRLEGAIRSFETVLLLEPNNHEAKMYLAACLRNQLNLHPDEACNYYREIINDPVQDKWSGLAQQALAETFLWFGPEEKLRWLQSAASQTTNEMAADFYRQQAKAAEKEAIINAGDSPKAEELAEERLFDSIRSADNYFHHKMGTYTTHLGMNDYVEAIGRNATNAADKLAALLPKMKKTAPDLEAYLVTSVLSFQPDTNTPVVAEFQAVLTNSIEHPKRDLNPGQLWADMSGIWWWCYEKTNYPLAIQLMETTRRAAIEGLTDFGDDQKIQLAYSYMAVTRWQDALDIFESFTNRPVRAAGSGPWGEAFQPILTDKMADYCRKKLGLSVAQDPRKFDMGKPLMCLCSPSTFVADDNGLWVGIDGQLLYLDFDLKTNLVVKLPMDDSVPITTLCLTSSNIWIGTRGAGLIEFDKASHQCRRLTETDGLMMNDLASLEVAGDSLWIGYGGATGGGLGQLDLRSRKLSSFMPSLNADAVARTGETPPRDEIKKIVAGPNGDLWMSVASGVRQFHASRDVWETLPNKAGDWVTSFSADSAWLVEGGGFNLTEIEIQNKPNRNAPTNEIKKTKLAVTSAELAQLQANLRTNGSHQYVSSYSSGGIRPRGALAIQNLRDHHWQNLVDADGLPNPPSTLTLDGNNLWVGGEGAIALVDLKEAKVRKFCHIKATGVDRIQIAGGYVWAQFDRHLYRAPLSNLQ